MEPCNRMALRDTEHITITKYKCKILLQYDVHCKSLAFKILTTMLNLVNLFSIYFRWGNGSNFFLVFLDRGRGTAMPVWPHTCMQRPTTFNMSLMSSGMPSSSVGKVSEIILSSIMLSRNNSLQNPDVLVWHNGTIEFSYNSQTILSNNLIIYYAI